MPSMQPEHQSDFSSTDGITNVGYSGCDMLEGSDQSQHYYSMVGAPVDKAEVYAEPTTENNVKV